MSDGRRMSLAYFVVAFLAIVSLACVRGSPDGLVAEAGGPYASNECESVLLDGSGSVGAELYRWQIDDVWSDWSSSPYFEFSWLDDYNGMVTLEVSAGNQFASDTASVLVGNMAPFIMSVSGPSDSVSAGSPVEVSMAFMDGDLRDGLVSDDSFIVEFGWGDGSSSLLGLGVGSGQVVVGSHVYKAAGVYTVSIKMTDDDGGGASGGLVVSVSAPLFSFGGLRGYLEGLGLPKGTVTSLEAKVSGAQAAFDAGNYHGAAGKLGAFMDEVRAQRGKKIPAAGADELLRLAGGLLGSFPG